MKDLITKKYNGVEVHFEIIDGESYVAIEDVARFCGWTQVKNGKEYIRYERINEKLSLLSFPNVGENDYIPEKVFYPSAEPSNIFTCYVAFSVYYFKMNFYTIVFLCY